MKKALIALIAVIYATSIIIVSFLGVNATIHNEDIYVEKIELLNKSVLKEGGNPDNFTDYVIEVLSRPEESLIGEDGKGLVDQIAWNYNNGESKRDYAIFIRDTKTFYANYSKQLALETKVSPDNATIKKLVYNIEGPQNVVDTLNITSEGVIKFSKQYTSWVDVDILVQTTDLSHVGIDILLKINAY